MILLSGHYLLRLIFTTGWKAEAARHPLVTVSVVASLYAVYHTHKKYDEDNLQRVVSVAAAFIFIVNAILVAAAVPYGVTIASDSTTRYAPVTAESVTVTTNPGSPDFRVQMQKNNVSDCGPACKEVTATAWITNNGTASARGVHATLTLYGKLGLQVEIWNTTVNVGRLDPNSTEVVSQTVTFGKKDLSAVVGNGCAVDYEIRITHYSGEWTYEGTKQFEESQCDLDLG